MIDLAGMRHNSAAYLQAVNDAMNLAWADRDTYAADADFADGYGGYGLPLRYASDAECGEFASPEACPSDCEWGLAAGGATPAEGIGAQTNKMEVGGEGEGGCTGVGLLSKAYARMRRDMMLQVAVYVCVYTRVCVCDMYV